ncbi:hypothetical protein [Intrasporangium calvum]|uniref:hypothetical protein n=1 Tax=Intrasporangium calvum TaxID=53358 RepID=UPI001FD06E63|nr:hypothetical protein [Intrasporangium calvum]
MHATGRGDVVVGVVRGVVAGVVVDALEVVGGGAVGVRVGGRGGVVTGRDVGGRDVALVEDGLVEALGDVLGDGVDVAELVGAEAVGLLLVTEAPPPDVGPPGSSGAVPLQEVRSRPDTIAAVANHRDRGVDAAPMAPSSFTSS